MVRKLNIFAIMASIAIAAPVSDHYRRSFTMPTFGGAAAGQVSGGSVHASGAIAGLEG